VFLSGGGPRPISKIKYTTLSETHRAFLDSHSTMTVMKDTTPAPASPVAAPPTMATTQALPDPAPAIVSPTTSAPPVVDISSSPLPQALSSSHVAAKKPPASPHEVVVVCIDVSGSMETPFECDGDARTVDRTRLEAVKQCFYGKQQLLCIIL